MRHYLCFFSAEMTPHVTPLYSVGESPWTQDEAANKAPKFPTIHSHPPEWFFVHVADLRSLWTPGLWLSPAITRHLSGSAVIRNNKLLSHQAWCMWGVREHFLQVEVLWLSVSTHCSWWSDRLLWQYVGVCVTKTKFLLLMHYIWSFLKTVVYSRL